MAKVQSKSSWSLTKTAPGGKQNVIQLLTQRTSWNSIFFFELWLVCDDTKNGCVAD